MQNWIGIAELKMVWEERFSKNVIENENVSGD